MSRIITENYSNRLNILINEFETSPNLSSIVNFFLKEVHKDQNGKVSKNQKVFSTNNQVKLIELKESIDLNKTYTYIKIIVNAFKGQYLHIHINLDLSDDLCDNLITLFVWESFLSGLYDCSILNKEIEELSSKISRELYLPNDNGPNENRIRRERKGLRHRLNFINHLANLKNHNPPIGVLLNTNKGLKNSVYLSEFSEFPKSTNNYLNFGDNLKNIFLDMGREKVEALSVILNLFPSFTGRNIWYKDFIRDEIMRYNNFKKVITITSGEKTAEKLLEMQKQNKFQAEEMYTIFSFEL
jgi:hypothetical protein